MAKAKTIKVTEIRTDGIYYPFYYPSEIVMIARNTDGTTSMTINLYNMKMSRQNSTPIIVKNDIKDILPQCPPMTKISGKDTWFNAAHILAKDDAGDRTVIHFKGGGSVLGEYHKTLFSSISRWDLLDI